MSDLFFDVDRAAGTYPPKGYGWLDDEAKKNAILRYFKSGFRDQWMYEHAKYLKMDLPAEYQPYQG